MQSPTCRQSDAWLWQREPCTGHRHAHVTSKDDFHPAANGVSIHSCNNWFDEIKAFCNTGEACWWEIGAIKTSFYGKVGARTECLVARACDDGDKMLIAVRKHVEKAGKLMMGVRVQCVAAMLPINCQDQRPVLCFPSDPGGIALHLPTHPDVTRPSPPVYLRPPFHDRDKPRQPPDHS